MIDPDDLVVDAILAVPSQFQISQIVQIYTSGLNTVDHRQRAYPFLSADCHRKSVMGKGYSQSLVGTSEKQVFYSASYQYQ